MQYGGELVEISDLATNEFVARTLNALWWQNNGVWLGLNDRHSEQQWRWAGSGTDCTALSTTTHTHTRLTALCPGLPG